MTKTKMAWLYIAALAFILILMISPSDAGVFNDGYIWAVCTRYGTGMHGLVEMGKFVNSACGYW